MGKLMFVIVLPFLQCNLNLEADKWRIQNSNLYFKEFNSSYNSLEEAIIPYLKHQNMSKTLKNFMEKYEKELTSEFKKRLENQKEKQITTKDQINKVVNAV